MAKTPKVAVLLAGCGHLDGAEVREAAAVTDVVVGETSVKVGLDDDRGGDAIEAVLVQAATSDVDRVGADVEGHHLAGPKRQ